MIKSGALNKKKGTFRRLLIEDLSGFPRVVYSEMMIAASYSKCRRRKVGAATGTFRGDVVSAWNATDCDLSAPCAHEGMGEGTNQACNGTHAEIILLRKIERERQFIDFLCVTTFPCEDCARAIVEAKIGRVYYKDAYGGNLALDFLLESGVDVIHIIH